MAGMKQILVILAAMALSACVPLSIYYRDGVSVAKMEKDTTECQVKALRDVPVSTQIRRGAPIFYPGRRICDSSGKCYYEAGYYAPGPIYSVDPNEGLRASVESQCMADRGYTPVSIPTCPNNISKTAPAGVTTQLPRLTPSSCVIRNSGGSWQIVSRAQ
jgi:hypothetical protein